MPDRLYRSRHDTVIGGVAGGVAEALDIDPSIVRVVWVLLAFMTGGLAALVYLIMLIVVPQEPEGLPHPGDAAISGAADYSASQPADPAAPSAEASTFTGTAPRPRRRRNGGGGALVFGVILILVGAYFLVRQYIPAIDLDLIWPVVVIVVGGLLVLGALRAGDRTNR
jgi:phage shock protein PspC (stress-responsive transcriptional regulator)